MQFILDGNTRSDWMFNNDYWNSRDQYSGQLDDWIEDNAVKAEFRFVRLPYEEFQRLVRNGVFENKDPLQTVLNFNENRNLISILDIPSDFHSFMFRLNFSYPVLQFYLPVNIRKENSNNLQTCL